MNQPVRYGSRYASPPADAATPTCPVCAGLLPSARAHYCSEACKQPAYRLRHRERTATEAAARAAELKRLCTLVAHTLYECPVCGERSLGVQRCPDCHRFGRALGLGGACPHCDELILSAELLA